MDYTSRGDLYSFMQRQDGHKLTHAGARFVGAQVADALTFLHNGRIVYRNLKPESLLLADDGYVLLHDFGLVKQLTLDSPRTFTTCGTPAYFSPEIIKNSSTEGHSYPTDWWTLGILLFELLAGHSPFD